VAGTSCPECGTLVTGPLETLSAMRWLLASLAGAVLLGCLDLPT